QIRRRAERIGRPPLAVLVPRAPCPVGRSVPPFGVVASLRPSYLSRAISHVPLRRPTYTLAGVPPHPSPHPSLHHRVSELPVPPAPANSLFRFPIPLHYENGYRGTSARNGYSGTPNAAPDL
ncbi:MAG TPA: hypothetical protein VGD56_16295, partial [Gemmatirosa sp.]